MLLIDFIERFRQFGPTLFCLACDCTDGGMHCRREWWLIIVFISKTVVRLKNKTLWNFTNLPTTCVTLTKDNFQRLKEYSLFVFL